jgi:CubicO group peptidase (beta-lactamase class C family)
MKTTLEQDIRQRFARTIQRDKHVDQAFLLVHNERLGLHLELHEGQDSAPRQRFYTASIGKMFTAVVIARLVEAGRLSYDDPISLHLDRAIWDGLHVYRGVDYSATITIEQLLRHTSGLGDYFDDRPQSGPSALDQVRQNPLRHHAPQEWIDFTKRWIRPRFRPGQGFHYSDTGYHLLGLLIEAIEGRPLHRVIDDHIIQPLSLTHTHMTHPGDTDEQAEDIARLYWDGEIVNHYALLKDDFAGGGIVSNTYDLFVFLRAFVQGELVSDDAVRTMTTWNHKGSLKLLGIRYGHGIMHLHPVPLFFPKRYASFGHIGSIGSFLFYNPASDTYLVGTVNRFRYHRLAMKLFIQALRRISRESGSRKTE